MTGREGMRVLYVSAVAERKGGAETVLLEMLANPLVQPSLAVPGPGALSEHATSLGLPVHLFDLGSVAGIRRPLRLPDAIRVARDGLDIARGLSEIARRCEADIVHTNGMKVHVTGVVARARHRTPTVIHLHDVPYTRAERLIWRGLGAGALHTIAASEICVPSDRSPARTSIVRQGVDAAPARTGRTLSDPPTLGFVGRFHPFKGVHLLLDWFEASAASFPTLTLLLRGRADAEGADYWASLRPRAERLAQAGRCRIEPWRSEGQDPYAGIDVLVAPSATPEVGPRVIMEAMLRGIPAIGYPAGGGLAMIPGPACGAHADDSASFAAALHRLLDPVRYASVSEAALSHAAETFGIERFWRELRDAYALALSRAPDAAFSRRPPRPAPVPSRRADAGATTDPTAPTPAGPSRSQGDA